MWDDVKRWPASSFRASRKRQLADLWCRGAILLCGGQYEGSPGGDVGGSVKEPELYYAFKPSECCTRFGSSTCAELCCFVIARFDGSTSRYVTCHPFLHLHSEEST